MILQVGMPTRVGVKNSGQITIVPKSELRHLQGFPIYFEKIKQLKWGFIKVNKKKWWKWLMKQCWCTGWLVYNHPVYKYSSSLGKPSNSKFQLKEWVFIIQTWNKPTIFVHLIWNSWNLKKQPDFFVEPILQLSSWRRPFRLAIFLTPSLFKVLPSSMWLWSAKRT